MGEENIRKRVVSSFRTAIDLEQNNCDLEAYRNYLDGLALVAAALQEDAVNSWSAGCPFLSDKERRSLLGFAKQSVERLIFLLDKQDDGSTSIFKGATGNGINHDGVEQHGTCPNSPTVRRTNETLSPTNCGAVRRKDNGNALPFEIDQSPICRMKEENKRIIAQYTARLHSVTSKPQRHNLQLELERRLTENSAIAQQQQEVWEQQRNKTRDWCQQTAKRKFNIQEKIDNGKITEADFRKQRVFAESLQYEEEHLWLKRLKQELLNSPHDERRQRDVINRVLQDKLHPLGRLMWQMQRAVLDKVSPIISKHKDSLPAPFNGNINEPRQQTLSVSSVNSELYDLAIDAPKSVGIESDQTSYEITIAKEEEEAFQRHFQNIADDIKQDIKFLETLLAALFEPLSTEKSANVMTEQVHEEYFSSIKSSLILLLRLSMKQAESELSNIMSTKDEIKDLIELEERVKRTACAALHRLASLHNPCYMIDSLVATLKILATNTDENNASSIGADDLLPRLMTVVLSCGMPSLLAETTYMESFMPVCRALGEAGYCLTVLQSVLTCVQLHTG